MGGYGSSRWGFHRKKDTVEDCHALSIAALVKYAGLAPDVVRISGIAWHNTFTKEKVASIGVHIFTTDTSGWVRLSYSVSRMGSGEKQSVEYTVPLVTTVPRFGGVRWWFRCPGKDCGRRVGVLYFPPGIGVRYFLCRHCYDLAYRSSQEHDKSRDRFRRLGWAELMALVQGGGGDAITSLKAAGEVLDRAQRFTRRR